jgi:hypothetical protein
MRKLFRGGDFLAVYCKCGLELKEYEVEHVDDHDGDVYHEMLYVLAADDHDAGLYNGDTQTTPHHDSAQRDEEGAILGDWLLGKCEAPDGLQMCRVCACTADRLSEGCLDDGFDIPCHWVEVDLCSGCVGREAA